jgi:RNA polymerase sigma factor (sigma-70 family)
VRLQQDRRPSRSECFAQLRRLGDHPDFEVEASAQAPSPVGSPDGNRRPARPGRRGVDVEETLRRFYRLLDKLKADDRLIFVLRRVDGMQLEDVGHATERSVATVKRRLAKADAELVAAGWSASPC